MIEQLLVLNLGETFFLAKKLAFCQHLVLVLSVALHIAFWKKRKGMNNLSTLLFGSANCKVADAANNNLTLLDVVKKL